MLKKISEAYKKLEDEYTAATAGGLCGARGQGKTLRNKQRLVHLRSNAKFVYDGGMSEKGKDPFRNSSFSSVLISLIT